jgi:hypothetical protein
MDSPAASVLPHALTLYASQMLGLPPAAADLVDLHSPAAGVILESGDRLDGVVALQLTNAAEFLRLVTSATAPRFDREPEAGSGPLLLVPNAPLPAPVTLAMTNDYLVIGTSRDAVIRGADHVARTVRLTYVPVSDLFAVAPNAATSGALLTRLTRAFDAWKNVRDNDENGAPARVWSGIDAEVGRLFAVFGDLAEARLRVDAEGSGRTGHFRFNVQLVPTSASGHAGSKIASMQVATADSILAYPSSTPLVLVTHEAHATDGPQAIAKIGDVKLAGAEGVLWSAGADTFVVAQSKDAKPPRPILARAPGTHPWADEPVARMLLQRLGQGIDFAMFADAARLMGQKPSDGAVPLVLAYGKEGPASGPQTAWLEADVPSTALLSWFGAQDRMHTPR